MASKKELKKKKKIETIKKAAEAAKADALTNSSRDAELEKQTASKYGSVSPILSKGVFTAAAPKQVDTHPSLTQEKLNKKKKGSKKQ